MYFNHGNWAVRPFGVSGPPWKTNSCWGHIVNTQTLTKASRKKKSRHVFSNVTISCWAAFTALLGGGHPCGRFQRCPGVSGKSGLWTSLGVSPPPGAACRPRPRPHTPGALCRDLCWAGPSPSVWRHSGLSSKPRCAAVCRSPRGRGPWAGGPLRSCLRGD